MQMMAPHFAPAPAPIVPLRSDPQITEQDEEEEADPRQALLAAKSNLSPWIFTSLMSSMHALTLQHL